MAIKRKPAAQEYGGEEPVLALTDAIADDSNEPEEGHPRERHEVQGQDDLPSPARVGEPRSIARSAGHRGSYEHQCRREQEGEQDARHCGGTRRPQGTARCYLFHNRRLPWRGVVTCQSG
jgi:hypothetical protein